MFAVITVLIGQSVVFGSSKIHDIRLDRFFSGPIAQTDSEYYVHGELAFIGSGIFESLFMHYQIDGGEVHTTFFDNIGLNPQIPFYYEADEHWVPSSEGNYDLELWFSGLNGAPIDEGVSDTLLIEVAVYEYLPARELVLLESFSSQNCGSCAIVNPQIRTMVNSNPENYSMIFYHPLGYENSPLYLFNPRDHDIRRDFYGVTYTPLANIGGLFFGPAEFVKEDMMDLEMMKPAAFEIDASYYFDNDTIYAEASAFSHADFQDQDLRLFISLTEDEVHFDEPPGSNGEQSFYHVMRAFVPDAGGIQLGDLDAGSEFAIEVKRHLDVSIVDTTRIQLLAFIQDMETREIFQVSRLYYDEPEENDNGDNDGDNGDDDNDDNGDRDETSVPGPDAQPDLLVYPNPATSFAFVKPDKNLAINNIRIFDLRGRVVLTKEIRDQLISDSFRIDTEALEPGIYIIKVETDRGVFHDKLTITR